MYDAVAVLREMPTALLVYEALSYSVAVLRGMPTALLVYES